jgi:hypothetical protein
MFHLAPFVILLLALGLYAIVLLSPAHPAGSESGRRAAPLMGVGLLAALSAATYACYKLDQSPGRADAGSHAGGPKGGQRKL